MDFRQLNMKRSSFLDWLVPDLVGLLIIFSLIGLFYYTLPLAWCLITSVVLIALYTVYRVRIYKLGVAYFKSRAYHDRRLIQEQHTLRHNHAVRYLNKLPARLDLNKKRMGIESRSLVVTYQVNVSLAVLRQAEKSPIEYVIKYFEVDASQENVAHLQYLNELFRGIKQAVGIVDQEKRVIQQKIRHPWYVEKYNRRRLRQDDQLDDVNKIVTVAQYVFQYTSEKGRSRDHLVVRLDEQVVECIYQQLSERYQYEQTASYQRSLMTPQLRQAILKRDNYTCQNPICGESLHRNPKALLEIDHIIPIAKGGITTPDNLQVLCRTCNRQKGSKIVNW